MLNSFNLLASSKSSYSICTYNSKSWTYKKTKLLQAPKLLHVAPPISNICFMFFNLKPTKWVSRASIEDQFCICLMMGLGHQRSTIMFVIFLFYIFKIQLRRWSTQSRLRNSQEIIVSTSGASRCVPC